MERKVINWTLKEIYDRRDLISFPGFQREPHLWTVSKKQLLIDSIFRDIDIPKLYFYRTEDGDYEVIDGQQRLWAIWDFMDGEFQLTSDALGKPKYYRDLTEIQKEHFDNYELQIAELDTDDEDYLRLLFLRLQLGLLLVTGEKLNAAKGEMRDFVFNQLAGKRFIQRLGIPKRRFAKQTLCAQITINAFSQSKIGEFSRTRYEDLEQFFKEYEQPVGQDQKIFEEETSSLIRTMDDLWQIFGEDAEKLKNRSYILSVSLLYRSLAKEQKFAIDQDKEWFVNFVLTLWSRLREEAKSGIDRTNRELFALEGMMSSAPGEKYQIKKRHEKLYDFLEHYRSTGVILGDPD